MRHNTHEVQAIAAAEGKRIRKGSKKQQSSRATKLSAANVSGRNSGPHRQSPNSEMVPLVDSLVALAGQVVELKKSARGLGIFTEDRGLLTCPTCGLMEDVLFDRRLVTCHQIGVSDTGLRFTEHSRNGGRFIFPECSTELLPK